MICLIIIILLLIYFRPFIDFNKEGDLLIWYSTIPKNGKRYRHWFRL